MRNMKRFIWCGAWMFYSIHRLEIQDSWLELIGWGLLFMFWMGVSLRYLFFEDEIE